MGDFPCDILGLIEPLFCLPMSNGHVECVFSQLNKIKTNRRTCLGEDPLDSLLQIATTGPPLSEWDSSHAVELWWSYKKGKLWKICEHHPRRSLALSNDTDNDTESTSVSLDDWEDWAFSVCLYNVIHGLT